VGSANPAGRPPASSLPLSLTNKIVRNREEKLSMERIGSKFEARNSEFETNPNVPNSKVFSSFGVLGLLEFEIVSGFDIRISDFSILQTYLAAA
jgi:hypothetical protein